MVGPLWMFAGGLGTYAAAQYFLSLEPLWAGAAGLFAGIVVGLAYNLVATLRNWKKIHWIDFLLHGLILPW